MKVFFYSILVMILFSGCAMNNSSVKQQSWDKMMDSSDYKEINTELINLNKEEEIVDE